MSNEPNATTAENKAASGGRSLIGLMLRSSSVNVLIVVISTLNAALVARILGVEGRGHLFLLFLPMYFAPLGCNLGLHRLAIYLGKREQRQAAAVHLAIGAAAATVFAVIWCLIFPFYIEPKYTSLNTAIVILTLAGTVSFTAATYLQALAAIDRRFIIPDVAKFILPLLNGLLLGCAFLLDIGSPEILLGFQIVCRLAEILFISWALRRLFRTQQIERQPGLPRQNRRYSLRFWQSDLMGLLQQHLDKILVSLIATTSEMGIYAVSVTLAMSARQLVGNVTNVIIARVNAQDEAEMRRTFSRWTLIYFGLGLVLWPICLVVLEYPVALVFGKDFSGVAHITSLLLLNVILASVAWLVIQPLLLTGHNRVQVRAQLAGTLLFVSGSVWAVRESSLEIFIYSMIAGSLLKLLICLARMYFGPHSRQPRGST
ncbi:lipopolysaccharide biosynthesis protein [Marinobacter sp. JSM 1782161]|uniref:lipopolysaccharide biosynthesis protein n=1 Tax=Marinobacter sp. JSM 1782161 TaxID=2685906 RepID=UPI00140393AB|nr:oligosaccharide flippase family protein [Marinobacter sp. JSM 1782161]